MGADTGIISISEAQTFEAARELAESMPLPAHILLYGDLGAGKTSFTRGLAAGFGLREVDEVASPTFTLINEYTGDAKIFHIDLYRIETGRLEGLGLDEIFDNPKAAVIVEWAERLGNFPTPGAVQVFLEYVDEGSRKIDIKRS
jgi:tRNA threonylcarbamoyladenosine biosynthesis protein TsaE